jgi:hypothetical protein
MVKIHQLGYIQYMNKNENNFSLIRNSEINRLCKKLTQHCYKSYKINEYLQKKDAFEIHQNKPIWEIENYTPKYCNEIINLHYNKQYCIVGLETLFQNYNEIKELYKINVTDFIILDTIPIKIICDALDKLDFGRMKCYSLLGPDAQLINYFKMIYASCDELHIMNRKKYMPLPYLPSKINHKKITIITPCIRPDNLLIIQKSIPWEHVAEWIIVYDNKRITENPNLFSSDIIKEYLYTGEGISGNPQRNYALDHVTYPDTYIYFLDDDNIIKPKMYKLLDIIDNTKMYTFDQFNRIKGNNINLNHIDIATFR